MPQKKIGSPPALMLTLVTLIGFLSLLQLFCTPVMLPLIGRDLNLNTAQLGLIWGMSTFGGLFFSIPGGMLGDRIGPWKGIFTLALVIGIFLGLRGLARDTAQMAIVTFVGGGVIGGLGSLTTKSIFIWFPRSRVGLANGLWASAVRLGMAVGSAISIAVIALVHSWQNTYFLYAACLIFVSLLWLLLIREPPTSKTAVGVPFREAITHSIKSRNLWLCVIGIFGAGGLNTALVGYLPTYLQGIGWPEVTSSLVLTVYFLCQVVGSLILFTLSDILRLRKVFFIVPSLIWIGAIALLAVTKVNWHIWSLIVVAGIVYGGPTSIIALIIAETKEIGARYAGTANSISTGFGGGAGLIFASVCGKFALSGANLPFIVGPLLGLACVIPFFFVKETGTRNIRSYQDNT